MRIGGIGGMTQKGRRLTLSSRLHRFIVEGETTQQRKIQTANIFKERLSEDQPLVLACYRQGVFVSTLHSKIIGLNSAMVIKWFKVHFICTKLIRFCFSVV